MAFLGRDELCSGFVCFVSVIVGSMPLLCVLILDYSILCVTVFLENESRHPIQCNLLLVGSIRFFLYIGNHGKYAECDDRT